MNTPLVGIIMGSKSDWNTMKAASDVLEEFGVPYEKFVISAHRTPEKAIEYASTARERGLKVIITGAGGAAARDEEYRCDTHHDDSEFFHCSIIFRLIFFRFATQSY